MTSVAIPNRPVFRAQEVCEIAEVQPYVLRTWEAEFPDLGVAKGTNGPRLYRRADVERVLRIKHLILVDGLTLAGARRQLGEEQTPASGDALADADIAALMDGEVQRQLRDVRRGLQWILGVLTDSGVPASPFVEASNGSGTGRRQAAGPRTSRPASGGARATGKSTKAAPRDKKR